MMEHLIASKFPKATVSLLFSDSQAGPLTTYTFSSKSTGTPGNRRAIAVALGHGSATVDTLNSLTVDGVALSSVVADVEDGGGITKVEIWIGWLDNANTTGDYVFTFSGTTSVCLLFAYEIHNLESLTAVGTDTEETDATALTCTRVADGVSIGAALVNAVTTFSWTGDLADGGDATTGSLATLSAASGAHSTSGTTTTTPDAATATNFNAILASFR